MFATATLQLLDTLLELLLVAVALTVWVPLSSNPAPYVKLELPDWFSVPSTSQEYASCPPSGSDAFMLKLSCSFSAIERAAFGGANPVITGLSSEVMTNWKALEFADMFAESLA